MRLFSRGDLDGFFGLALDNLVQLLLIVTFWKYVLKFPDDLLYHHVLPGVAVSLLVGNLYYAWQALRLARATGRTDVCALPYGINTVSLIAYALFVMLPAKEIAMKQGGVTEDEAARIAWQAGLVACLGCGLIELVGAFVAERIRKSTPRAALLSTLAGIALAFICLGFVFRTFARPIVGLTTLGIILLTYFGKLRFRGGLPGGFVAVALGTLLAWVTGIAGTEKPTEAVHFHAPLPVWNDLLRALGDGHFLTYLSVIIPMGLFNLIGSLQNIESAEAAGDSYPTAPSLAVNGIGSVAAALFGSCFPTTIYIGHPGWKALGARAGYSVLNGLFFTVVCLTGTLAYISWAVPVDAGMAIVIWIGLVITAQAFQASPPEHAPAVVVGLIPGMAAWGVYLVNSTLSVAHSGLSKEIVKEFAGKDIYLLGALALDQGFIFTSMILAAATVAVIERQFVRAFVWCMIASVLTTIGLMHSFQWDAGTTRIALNLSLSSPWFLWQQVPWPWVAGYAIMGCCFLSAQWLTVPDKGH